MTQENQIKIIELHNLGVTQVKIAEQLGISRQTVARYLKTEQNDNMIGKIFGQLTVLERDYSSHKDNNKYYKCQCSCGKICIVRGNSLRTGHTKSCGCLQKKKASEIGNHNVENLIGQKFGKLTVLSRSENSKNNRVVWHCKCECGNECDILAYNLKNGNTQSCGCLLSINENKIAHILNEKHINYK